MSGSNGLTKLSNSFNRENELVQFKTRGPQFFHVDQHLVNYVNLNPIDLFSMLLFDATTPAVLNAPSGIALATLLNELYLNDAGSTWKIVIHNSDVNPKTINFPGDYSTATLVIPPQTFFEVGLNLAGSAGTFNLYQGITSSSQVTDPFALVGNGYLVKTGPGTYVARTIVSTAADLIVTNSSGVSGNTSLAFSAPVQSFFTFNDSASMGFVIKTAAGTYRVENLIPGTGITISDPGGQAGTTTFSFNGMTAVVAPTVLGQATVQGALQALAAASASISTVAGTGYLVQTAPNTFVTRSLTSGSADLTINPVDGVASGTIFTFSANAQNFFTFNSSTGANSTGFVIKTAQGAYQCITLQAGTGITITDPSGTTALPTQPTIIFNGTTAVVSPTVLGQSNVQAALQALAAASSGISTIVGTGYVIQTAPNTFVTGSIVSSSVDLIITNGSGVAGNTSFAFSANVQTLFNYNDGGTTGFVVKTGAGTYRSVTLTAGTGITITDAAGQAGTTTISFNGATAVVSPAVLGQTTVQSTLQALATASTPISTIAGTGYVVQTSANAFSTRTIVSSSTDLVITNGNAVAGNSSFAFSAPVQSLFAFNDGVATGFVIKTGAGTYQGLTLTAGTGITISDPAGQAGTTTFSFNGNTAVVSPAVLAATNVQAALQALATAATPISTVAGTGYLVQTAANTFATRTFTAGQNIALTNASGVAGNTTIAFNKTGVTQTGVWAQFFSGFGTTCGNITNVDDILEWLPANSDWESSSTFPITTASLSQSGKVVNCFQVGTAQSWSVNGPFYSGNFGTWGQVSATPTTGALPLSQMYFAGNSNDIDWQRRDCSMLTIQNSAGATTGASTLANANWRFLSMGNSKYAGSALGNVEEVFFVDGQGNYGGLGAATFISSHVPSTLAVKQPASIIPLLTYMNSRVPGLTASTMINNLSPVAYLYNFESPTQPISHIGFIADTLQALGPMYNELASYDSTGALAGVNLLSLIVITMQSLKEQVVNNINLTTQISNITSIQTTYSYYYDTTTQSVTLANTFNNVTFNTPVNTSGFTYSGGNFTCTIAGSYSISYKGEISDTSALGGGATFSMRVMKNAIEVPGSQTASQLVVPALGVPISLPMARTVPVTLAVGDIIGLQFTATDTSAKLTTGIGTGTVKPSVTLFMRRFA